jgi:predicted Zn-dependent protease
MPEPRITTFMERLAQALSGETGVKVWDIYGQERGGIAISAERGAIKTAQSTSAKEYAVRVYGSKGNFGFAHSNILSKSAMESTIQNAVKMLAATNPDPDFKDLPPCKELTSRGKDFFDRKTTEMTVEEVFGVLQLMLDRHSQDAQLYTTNGSVEVASSTTIIHNSNGISLSEKHSQAFAYFEAIIKHKGVQCGGAWWDSATAMKFLKPDQIADIGVERAKKGLPRHEVVSGDYPVILSPNAVGSIILRPLIAALSADNVQYQRTFLGNPLDQKIGSERLNLRDDPFERQLTGSRYFDAEGVPTQSMDLVKDGTVKHLLHNSYTAFRVGADPNGHATRGSINSVPSIDTNNEIFAPGDCSLEELCEGIKYGIYFDETGDSPNLASGDFSGLILNGFLIENGKIGPALENTLMGINVRDLFARIEAVGKDLTIRGSSIIPHIRISSAKITSGA